MRAAVLVIQRPPYHGNLMIAALQGMGYRVGCRTLPDVRPGDVLVTWNRHFQRERDVTAHERGGGTVLVVENGYFGRNFRGSEWYALARGQHNGAGEWPEGDEARWRSLGVELQPWRQGREIVVLASRGMGSPLCREPKGWSERVADELRKVTDRPVRIRAHPGPQKAPPRVPLADDLADAWAAVTWGSSAGLQALVLGVPVFHGFPRWIGAGAALPWGSDIEAPFRGNREPMFRRVATAMWSREEIADGTAFSCHL